MRTRILSSSKSGPPSRECSARPRLVYARGVGDIGPHLTTNVEQYTQRIKMRDDVDAPREVEHFANFLNIKDARTAARQLEALGFAVEVTRRRILQATLVARVVSTVDVETADVMVEQVFGVCEANRGDYDGWGAPIVRE